MRPAFLGAPALAPPALAILGMESSVQGRIGAFRPRSPEVIRGSLFSAGYVMDSNVVVAERRKRR